MMLPGTLPPPLWHPPVAMGREYLNAPVEKFPVQVMPGHRTTPRLPWGQGWRKGGDHRVKRGFLQSRYFFPRNITPCGFFMAGQDLRAALFPPGLPDLRHSGPITAILSRVSRDTGCTSSAGPWRSRRNTGTWSRRTGISRDSAGEDRRAGLPPALFFLLIHPSMDILRFHYSCLIYK
jgi:hypothetical protein